MCINIRIVFPTLPHRYSTICQEHVSHNRKYRERTRCNAIQIFEIDSSFVDDEYFGEKKHFEPRTDMMGWPTFILRRPILEISQKETSWLNKNLRLLLKLL